MTTTWHEHNASGLGIVLVVPHLHSHVHQRTHAAKMSAYVCEIVHTTWRILRSSMLTWRIVVQQKRALMLCLENAPKDVSTHVPSTILMPDRVETLSASMHWAHAAIASFPKTPFFPT